MEETISLKEIFEVLKKRIILILSLVVAAALISAVVSYFVITPMYESSSQFIVNQNEEEEAAQYDKNDIQSNVELINTYNVIIKSPAILDEVIDELDLSIGTGQLESKLDVSSAEDSQVVTVKATDADPEMATKMANTTVEVFQNEIPDLMNVDNVKVLSTAESKPNPSPVSPQPLLNIAIAIVLGAMVGVGLAFLLEYLDNTVKSEDDLEKKLNISVLGVVSRVDDDDIQTDHLSGRGNRNRRSGVDGTSEKTV